MPIPTPTLETDRLRLRPFADDDTDDLYALMSDREVLRYWDAPPWTDPDRAARFVQGCRDMEREDLGTRLAVTARADGTFLGWCGLTDWDPGFRSAGVTYCLARDAWGHGYGTEATGALLDWAYATLPLNRVQTEVDTRNPASARVLEKLGFVREGTLREDCVVDGEVSDSWVYGLLRRDRG
ncbi:GNAT family N-acetyltransferase [Phycicoccus flavus]|uniref:GNAT family N-acetyltransferase n=1 Tax=Phycicoccus flavus TaxID=2502783 RepID=UPI001F452497|nr:GNAT family N-acetyltransferase [Phycicoccus flavus]